MAIWDRFWQNADVVADNGVVGKNMAHTAYSCLLQAQQAQAYQQLAYQQYKGVGAYATITTAASTSTVVTSTGTIWLSPVTVGGSGQGVMSMAAGPAFVIEDESETKTSKKEEN